MDYFKDLIARHRKTAEVAEPVMSHRFTGDTPMLAAGKRNTDFLVNVDQPPPLLVKALLTERDGIKI